MKKLITLRSALRAIAALTVVIGCASTTTTTIAAPPQKEVMLQQAGFKTHTVTTARQKEHLQALPEGKVSIVMQNGKTFYAYPDVAHNQVYTGTEAQYQAYKQAQLQASIQNRGLNVDPDPHGIAINEFDGFGPLGGDER
ncbi:MAG TPA: hypothetical protein VN966_01415 [Candidatus Bathyarchaeia archaeon]|nr:hypothetical protein [Candidatus Bathyarchaeia archaeon]